MADYPREIYLDKETEEELVIYIEQELQNHYAERSSHLNDLMQWQKDYWAKPSTTKATFPFTGAATIVIPLSAIAIEAVHSRAMTTMFGFPQFVTARAISADWDHASKPFERFMDYEMLTQMRVRKPLGDCFLEAEKFGTMIGKVGYSKETKIAIREIAGEEQEFEVVVKDGPVFDCVPDSRFLMPYSAQDPQTAPWCGEEHSASPYELEQLEISGMFRDGTIIDTGDAAVDITKQAKLRAWLITQNAGNPSDQGGRQFDNNQATLENTSPVWPNQLDWVEIWLAYNVDKDPRGRAKEVVLHYHRDSRTIMSLRYNWHYDLRRPYRVGVYFPVEHRWRGIGICKQNEQFQREVTTQHRQRLDNATLANMRMIKVSKLSGYGPKEPIFPGKMWFVDDMTHVDTFQLGEIYPSAYNNEQATLTYSQQRSGVNETNLGMPQVGTPGTATSDLARIQEGNKKHDFIFSNFKEFTSDIIVDTASVIQQYGPRRLEYFDTAEGGDLVRSFFSMPDIAVREGLLISIKAAGQQQNKLLDRQNWQQVAAMIQQYYQGLMQLAMPLQNPQILQIIMMKGLGAATEAMRQLLESFDIRNIDNIVVKELEAQVRNGLVQAGAGPGGASGTPRTGSPAPMVGAPQAFPLIGAGGGGPTGGF